MIFLVEIEFIKFICNFVFLNYINKVEWYKLFYDINLNLS